MPVRLGTLYNIIGNFVEFAIVEKWDIKPLLCSFIIIWCY